MGTDGLEITAATGQLENFAGQFGLLGLIINSHNKS